MTKLTCLLVVGLVPLIMVPSSVSAITWNIESVDTDDYAGFWTSIVLDDGSRPHISYYVWGQQEDLRCAYMDTSNQWVIETVDTLGDVGKFSSIGWDEFGRTHISYYDASLVDLKWAYKDTSGWNIIRLPDSTDYVGQYTSLALHSFVSLRTDPPDSIWIGISYYDVGNGDLKYVWINPVYVPVTITTRVDSTGDVGLATSVALDSDGWPHISYVDATNGYLKHAWYGGGETWSIETVDNSGDVGEYSTSIAIGTSGYLHISYYDASAADLKYAVWKGSSWDISTVDTLGYAGKFSSIALNSSGYPRISYSVFPDTALEYLHYALWNGSAWVTDRVDGADVGSYNSLALDGSGYAHISYFRAVHQQSLGALKYAKQTSFFDGGPAEAEAWTSDPPLGCSLEQSSPTPFSLTTSIQYATPNPCHVSLRVYDIRGDLVRVLVDEHQEAGQHSAFWDGRDSEGRKVAAGIYFYHLSTRKNVGADALTATGKVVLLR